MSFSWKVSEGCSVRIRSRPSMDGREKGYLQEAEEVEELDRDEDGYGQLWIQHSRGWSVVFTTADEGVLETFLTPKSFRGEKIVWQVADDKMVRVRAGPGMDQNIVGSMSSQNHFVELERRMIPSRDGIRNQLWLRHKKGWSVFACASDDGVPAIFVLPVGVEEERKERAKPAAGPTAPAPQPPQPTPAQPQPREATGGKDDTCTICFEPFTNRWALVPCGHVMCDCSEDYLKSSKSCPFCRKYVTTRMKIFV